ncbi:MAG: thioredoxin domain-containing protein [Candidatus Berkelbacteria bacterium]|nr:thioredoxin domain-containing protein [Candidatus Berkelbacteria bacterium]
MKKGNGILIVIAIIGLIFGWLIVSSPQPNASTEQPKTTSGEIKPEWLYNDSAPFVGSNDAQLKIVVFSDYQCPYCKVFHDNMKSVISENQGNIKLIHRNLIVHPTATLLAQAVEAANLQGKFEQMDNAIFDKNPDPTEDSLVNLAKEIGLDETKFKNDLNSDQVKKRIDQDSQDASSLGLQGTPSVFLNGSTVDDPSQISTLVKSALNK